MMISITKWTTAVGEQQFLTWVWEQQLLSWVGGAAVVTCGQQPRLAVITGADAALLLVYCKVV